MIWQWFADFERGCSSYLLGDEMSGQGMVVDPLEAVGLESYVLGAQEMGLAIGHVVETHVHADHRSAARALAQAVGVPVSLSHRAPAQFSFRPLTDGQEMVLGPVTVTVWETPGHTPDSISLVVRDTLRDGEPWLVLTGDSLFVGDVGRPDLVDPDDQATRQAASDQFYSIRRLSGLPDFTEVYPAHWGASPCGGLYMSKKPNSTIGYERRSNQLLAIPTVEAFVEQQWRLLKPPPADATELRARNLGQVVR